MFYQRGRVEVQRRRRGRLSCHPRERRTIYEAQNFAPFDNARIRPQLYRIPGTCTGTDPLVNFLRTGRSVKADSRSSTVHMCPWWIRLVAAQTLLVLGAPINEPEASVESLTVPIDPSDLCATTNCSGTHGTCLAGGCVCHTHWRGAHCEEEACPRACSGHGSCLHETCYCSQGWVGVDCSVPEVRCAHDCSGRGHGCIGGRCLCAQGWAADDCSVPSDECPDAEGCNNHGKCSRGACVCDEGFGGAKCELMLCANDCHHRGYCAAPGRCVCHGGWRGASCEIRSGCAGFMWAHGRWHMCSGHGACNEHGVCECDPGWQGLGCAEGTGR